MVFLVIIPCSLNVNNVKMAQRSPLAIMEVIISIQNETYTISLNESYAAKTIIESLPVESIIQTWGDEISLRVDGRTWDIGYPQSIIRPDGKLVAFYYYTTKQHEEMHIGATIWDPGKVK